MLNWQCQVSKYRTSKHSKHPPRSQREVKWSSFAPLVVNPNQPYIGQRARTELNPTKEQGLPDSPLCETRAMFDLSRPRNPDRHKLDYLQRWFIRFGWLYLSCSQLCWWRYDHCHPWCSNSSYNCHRKSSPYNCWRRTTRGQYSSKSSFLIGRF